MRSRSLIAAALLVFAVTGMSRADVPPERQEALAHLLKHDCGSCHGMTRKGGLGKPLLAPALAEKTDADLMEIILDGVPGTPMPPWRPLLSDDDAAWLVRALRQEAATP